MRAAGLASVLPLPAASRASLRLMGILTRTKDLDLQRHSLSSLLAGEDLGWQRSCSWAPYPIAGKPCPIERWQIGPRFQED